MGKRILFSSRKLDLTTNIFLVDLNLNFIRIQLSPLGVAKTEKNSTLCNILGLSVKQKNCYSIPSIYLAFGGKQLNK